MKKSILSLVVVMLFAVRLFAQTDVIDLQGKWSFALDAENKGFDRQWYMQALPDSIMLPGTTEEAQKGNVNKKGEIKYLTRLYKYDGKAWYQRQVSIPAGWKDKRIVLVLERTKTTTVWVDGVNAGTNNSLTTMQEYDLSALLVPGNHTIMICVDNKQLPPVGVPHQFSDQTQTNWNGILGKIELRKTDNLWISDARVTPCIADSSADVRLMFACRKDIPVNGVVTISGESFNTGSPREIAKQTYACKGDTGRWIEFRLPIANVQLWSEFDPALYSITVSYKGKGRHDDVESVCHLTFGMREFKRNGTQFAINGKTIFLRGKHDACVFPLTGYAPMDVEGWLKVMQTAKSYGINHYRFHTWCPPEAAFQAADMLGIYMQPELPVWGSIGKNEHLMKGDVEQKVDNDPVVQRTEYLRKEGLRMLKAYGNHPSFVMFALGNEMSGSMATMADLIDTYRGYAPDKLYAQGSNNFLMNPRLPEGDDYWTTTMTGGHYSTGHYAPDTDGKEVRGSYPVHTKGHINNLDGGTMYDYGKAIEGVPVPVIGHETGQFEVYPDFNEIPKYTGVTRARNLETFRRRLDKAGMLHQARDFCLASGALAVECYREEIETALRTPGFGGLQLLDLQDFPGQGTALVGILDAFMDSKGLVTPEKWRQFCSEVVPLLRIGKRIWTSQDTLRADIQLANYGAGDVSGLCRWTLTGARGNTAIASGTVDAGILQQGGLRDVGTIAFTLDEITESGKFNLSLEIGGYSNTYSLWVYSDKSVKQPSRHTFVTKCMDAEALKRLERGENVLFIADTTSLKKHINGAFIPDFWCYPMFKRYSPPGTMGLLINHENGMFAGYPTDSHSDWQWWRMAKHSPVMVLDAIGKELKPVVQVIDNFARNQRLALVFEACVGKGKLVVSSIDLDKTQYPEVECLRQSVLRYMDSDMFSPACTLGVEDLMKLTKGSGE